MEPVAPRLMGQEAGREQEVTQHSECEEVAPHGFTPYYSTIILTRMVQTSTVWVDMILGRFPHSQLVLLPVRSRAETRPGRTMGAARY
jgi:hypothetical protein